EKWRRSLNNPVIGTVPRDKFLAVFSFDFAKSYKRGHLVYVSTDGLRHQDHPANVIIHFDREKIGFAVRFQRSGSRKHATAGAMSRNCFGTRGTGSFRAGATGSSKRLSNAPWLSLASRHNSCAGNECSPKNTRARSRH
ncbi:MAG: hypothetical protein M3Z85_06665, partial [Acidobacteriota bacterium]|nr:hypothetical protein [Acidobacteriota bacterium]